jgi:hypothetical protein
LCRDAGNRDVVNVDILLANQIKQQIQRTFVDIADRDRKRRVTLFFFRNPDSLIGAAAERPPATSIGATGCGALSSGATILFSALLCILNLLRLLPV